MYILMFTCIQDLIPLLVEHCAGVADMGFLCGLLWCWLIYVGLGIGVDLYGFGGVTVAWT